MKNRILFSTLFLTFFHLSAIGQVELKMLSTRQMAKDLEIFLETLDAHPDPYTKISKKDFQAKVREVNRNITRDLDEIDFYKNLAELMASIGDGHSSIYMSKFWLKELRKKNGAFPYKMFLSNKNELFVIKSYGDEQIPLGSQILEINGMAVDKFVEAVSPYISYETTAFRNDHISESFEFMLYLVFKKADKLNFKLKTSEVQVSTMYYKEWKEHKKDLQEERERMVAKGHPYDFKILKPGIAKIDIFSFAVPDLTSYNIFLNATFDKIKQNNVHSLIIDVRGNYGGWPKVASELFHYIHEGYFKTMAKTSMKVSHPYRSYYLDRAPWLRSIDVRFPERLHYVDLEALIKRDLGEYVNEDVFFNEIPVTEKYEFDGDCYLLIDRKSYSASSSFAATFQCYNMGILIGEPTGGTKVFRANPFIKTLPKTGLILRMSTTKLYSACFDQEDEPVSPHLVVTPSILDRVHNQDPQLYTALRVIKKIQKEREKGEK